MSRSATRRVLLLAVASGLLAAAPAAADDDDARDQEIARKALIEGRIRSLSEITAIVKPRLPGTILGVELEVEDDGRIVYEFDVIDSSGRLMEVEVDAATGDILKIEDDD
ncbi:MAG: PepSY domain-containing protein [Hyphomicrobium sp.]|nr:PepSY domain-containing protein [Hyphomicrobium sp.]